ncbi:mitochondrial intermediate peptidase [Mycena floridula]|nr:mitochondrial intermediate peptidase [Mycena floridula]
MISRSSIHALHRPAQQLFRFRGCLFTKAEKKAANSRSASTHATIPASADDKTLVSVFDRPVSNPRQLAFSGLFGHPSLSHPNGLVSLAQATLIRAQYLTERILRARESRDELLKVVKNLDRLSDILCGVIDLAELVRNVHPDRRWVDAANHAYESMCEFMNILNTHVGLYEILKVVLSDPSIVKTLSPEAHKTALMFWHDFEKSAIHLSPEQRSKFVTLSSEILILGRQFIGETMNPRPPTSIKPSELLGLKDQGMGVRLKLQARFTQRDLMVYPGSLQAQMIMRSAPEEEPRRRLFIASNSSTPEQIDILERLLRARGDLAQLVGSESYGDMCLDDKMAKSPTNVQYFLDALMDYTRPSARSALKALSLRKQEHLGTGPFPIIQAWDRDFYCPPEPPLPPIPLPPLTIGTAFMAMSRLFRHMYGVTLRAVSTPSDEVWSPDVHKLEVVDDDKGVVGWIYADLFSRNGKGFGAAHYTVRCSRRTDDDDEIAQFTPSEDVRDSIEFETANSRQISGQNGVYKLPVVVLVCAFTRPTLSRTSILEWQEVMTLFHEMGHAMHSMLGRTEYHNVSGTRCATDFVELPSILMEHFLSSPAVLSLFDIKSTTTARQSGNHHEDPCHAIDTYSQILLAALDQVYHSPVVMDKGFDSTRELEKLYNRRGLIPYVPGTSYQTQFGHLYGYGSTYYSYLFDRAIASRVWGNIFSTNPLDRERGEKFKGEVLRYGGGKDPWRMLSTLLSSPELESGDAEAMREVGKWRIEDEVGLPGRH